jgi:L-seryl-tRNA(Ser) seleniumtransferase
MSDAQPKPPDGRQELLQRIPAITELLKSPTAKAWLEKHPAPLVTDGLRRGVARARQQALAGADSAAAAREITAEAILEQARRWLHQSVTPHIRPAINATGIILHTGLGRAVLSSAVVDSVAADLKGGCTLAVDVATGERAERDELVEYILTELTGAEAATVVNNNAAATMLVLAALAAHKEVIVSRGQLIEIGGSFRLPEVMAQSQARLVEVGATNRVHPKDYRNAITPETAAILRVHPSNYRVVGFASEVGLRELAELARGRNVLLIDDLGAGALVDLQLFGLPHEPTVRESLATGADLVLFSGDKLIGGSQAGIIVGRQDLIQRLRQHPLMRAVRVDKTCLMLLERTLHLFRDPDKLRRENPTYRMLATPLETLRARAQTLLDLLREHSHRVRVAVADSVAYLGSGSLPTEAIPSLMLTVTVAGMSAEDLARRLRTDEACVFGRIEADQVRLDLRTLADEELPRVAAALGRIARPTP